MRWYQRFFRRERTEKRLDAELRFHIEQRIADLVAGGVAPEEARRQARLEFGGLDQVKEECRDVGASHIIETFVQDIRYGLRQLRRNPGFTAVVVLTLALGIGANTCIFSILNSLFLRGLPVPEPERVVSFSDSNFSWKDYVTYRDEGKSFASLSASYLFPFPVNLNSTEPPQHIEGELVTGNFLTTLGIKPILGRGFLPYEDEISSPATVVMLSYKLWRTGFGGDPDIVGKTIRLDNKGYTVVGVMPSDLRTVDFGMAPDLWAPMATLPQLDPTEAMARPFTTDEQGFWIFGRLKPGVSRQKAAAEVNLINDQMHTVAGKMEHRPVPLTTAGVLPSVLGRIFLGFSAVLMVVAGLVLLIACFNIANLLLARGTSRRKETAIRLALGAGRGRVIRQLMTENVILAFPGAAVGFLLALAATRAAARVHLPLALPIALNFAPDLRVVLVTAGLAVLTSLMFGLAPSARATRVDVGASLKDSGTASTDFATQRTRKVLVMVQVAVSVVVLVAGGLFLRSLRNGLSINLGFQPESLLVVKVDPAPQGYSGDRTAFFFQQLEQRVSRIRGVRSASVVAPLPLSIFSSPRHFSVPDKSGTVDANLHVVGPHYFETMGIPLLRGRSFGDIPASSPAVAVINRAMAERLFPDRNALGQRVGWENGKENKVYEIVGVAGNTKSKTVGEAFQPCFYELAGQNPKDLQGFSSFGGVSLVVKTVGEPKAMVPIVQQQVESLDPSLPVYGVETMQEQIGDSLVLTRLAASFLGVFGLLALALAAVGLYGLMSYTVVARTREIGIRMALGASAERTVFLLAKQGLITVGVGLAVGFAASIAVGHLVSGLLYGVSGFDPATFIAVPITLLFVACLAILLPARRAAKVDPMVALRYE
jgi:putative ABC transport system permease protein